MFPPCGIFCFSLYIITLFLLNKSTAHGCWTLDFFVSDIKLQAIYKVIHTSNYDGHISKYVCKIGKYNQKGIIFSCNTILVHMKKKKLGVGWGSGLYVGSGGLPFCNVFPLLIVNRYVGFHFNAHHSLYWENCIFRKKCKWKKGNNSNKMLDRVVFSCQQNGVNTFYKCIEFQVNSFDSYWEF